MKTPSNTPETLLNVAKTFRNAQMQLLRAYFAQSQNCDGLLTDQKYNTLHLAQEKYQLNYDIKTVDKMIVTGKQNELHETHPHKRSSMTRYFLDFTRTLLT